MIGLLNVSVNLLPCIGGLVMPPWVGLAVYGVAIGRPGDRPLAKVQRHHGRGDEHDLKHSRSMFVPSAMMALTFASGLLVFGQRLIKKNKSWILLQAFPVCVIKALWWLIFFSSLYTDSTSLSIHEKLPLEISGVGHLEQMSNDDDDDIDTEDYDYEPPGLANDETITVCFSRKFL